MLKVAGQPNQLFDTPLVVRSQVSVMNLPCSAFPASGSRWQFILSASNNAHYSPAMPAQHHAQDVMRAIESDRWAVRATNTGYSGIIDPRQNRVAIST